MNWNQADIDDLLSDDDIAVDATIDDGSIDGLILRGIYRRMFVVISDVEMNAPTLRVAAGDIEEIAEHGVRLRVNDTDYTITGIQPDGTGWTRLILREE